MGLGVVSEPGDCVQVKSYTLGVAAQNPAVRGVGERTARVPLSPPRDIRQIARIWSPVNFTYGKIMNRYVFASRSKTATLMTGWWGDMLTCVT